MGKVDASFSNQYSIGFLFSEFIIKCTCEKNNTFFGKFFCFSVQMLLMFHQFTKLDRLTLSEATRHFVFSFLWEMGMKVNRLIAIQIFWDWRICLLNWDFHYKHLESSEKLFQWMSSYVCVLWSLISVFSIYHEYIHMDT